MGGALVPAVPAAATTATVSPSDLPLKEPSPAPLVDEGVQTQTPLDLPGLAASVWRPPDAALEGREPPGSPGAGPLQQPSHSRRSRQPPQPLKLNIPQLQQEKYFSDWRPWQDMLVGGSKLDSSTVDRFQAMAIGSILEENVRLHKELEESLLRSSGTAGSWIDAALSERLGPPDLT